MQYSKKVKKPPLIGGQTMLLYSILMLRTFEILERNVRVLCPKTPLQSSMRF